MTGRIRIPDEARGARTTHVQGLCIVEQAAARVGSQGKVAACRPRVSRVGLKSNIPEIWNALDIFSGVSAPSLTSNQQGEVR